jgi:UDP-GlcNAc3NAcA epimerase
MKVCSVIGTRPNCVKAYLINQELKRRNIQEILIHTGQHYDYEMSQVFFECFGLPIPDIHLQIANTDSVEFSARSIVALANVFRSVRPDCILSYGDVNSTMSAAIAASRLRIPFVHLEGGIRTADRYNPEEINRRVSDVLADVIFSCTKTDVLNLTREGYERERTELSGDLMKDALLITLKQHNIVPARGDYHVMTLHRQENVTDETRLRAILEGIVKSGQRVLFPAHPRTLQAMKAFGLLELLRGSRVELCKPMGYVEFIRLAAGANKVLTDSGGVRREAYLLRKPCIVLIELSWFPEILQTGWKVLTGPGPERIAKLIHNFEPTGEHKELFGDGKAHRNIVDGLMRRYAR